MTKILIVDDEKDILDVLQEAFFIFGYEAEIAETVKDGINKFDNDRFDLVIIDMIMPDANGDRIVQHIRESNRQFTPVIGCSGTPWLLEGIDFDRVLTKPFLLKEILNAVQSLSAEFPRHNR